MKRKKEEINLLGTDHFKVHNFNYKFMKNISLYVI